MQCRSNVAVDGVRKGKMVKVILIEICVDFNYVDGV